VRFLPSEPYKIPADFSVCSKLFLKLRVGEPSRRQKMVSLGETGPPSSNSLCASSSATQVSTPALQTTSCSPVLPRTVNTSRFSPVKVFVDETSLQVSLRASHVLKPLGSISVGRSNKRVLFPIERTANGRTFQHPIFEIGEAAQFFHR